MNSTQFIILNAFDRAGSTAIVKTLGQSKDIEYLIHPFNGGPFRRSMYRIFTNDIATSEDHEFFKGLTRGELIEDYIVSWWHKKFSSTQTISEAKIHILKTTINHFSIKWIYENYESIDVWGIWRDPIEILNSILNNSFQDEWYSDAFESVKNTIYSAEEFTNYKDLYEKANTAVKKTAFLISSRSYYFFSLLNRERIIDYHQFKKDPQKIYNSFLKHYGINREENVEKYAQKDLNVIGKKTKSKLALRTIKEDELMYLKEVNLPLIKLMKQKFKLDL